MAQLTLKAHNEKHTTSAVHRQTHHRRRRVWAFLPQPNTEEKTNICSTKNYRMYQMIPTDHKHNNSKTMIDNGKSRMHNHPFNLWLIAIRYIFFSRGNITSLAQVYYVKCKHMSTITVIVTWMSAARFGLSSGSRSLGFMSRGLPCLVHSN